ncbi:MULTISPECIES: hypothetical protein [unclassified Pedobacter]|nr:MULTISPECIES: hypothetical protein [unclassified Pedobacter]
MNENINIGSIVLNSYMEEIPKDILRSCMDSLSYWDMWWSTR